MPGRVDLAEHCKTAWLAAAEDASAWNAEARAAPPLF